MRRVTGLAGLMVVVVSAILYRNHLELQNQQQTQAVIAAARVLVDRREYKACLIRLEGINSPESQQLKQLCELAADDQHLLDEAKKLAEQGQFDRAVTLARSLPSASEIWIQNKTLVEFWEAKLLEIATNLYEQQGKLKESVQLLRLIAADSPVAPASHERLERWGTEWAANDNRLVSARQAVEAKQWKQVQTVGLSLPTTTPYWAAQRENLLSMSQSQIEAAAKAEAEAKQAALLQNCQKTVGVLNQQVPIKLPDFCLSSVK